MPDFKPSKPTHRLKVLDKATNSASEIGAGWLKPDGSISIRLLPCVVLNWKDDVIINLFPIDNGPPAKD